MTFNLEDATNADTFSVFDFIAGASQPEGEYVIYTNADAALKLAKIFAEESARAVAAKDEFAGLADEEVADEETITALHTKLVESALTFHLKGLTPVELDELETTIKAQTGFVDGADNENYYLTLNNTIVAKSIQSVTNFAGAVDNNKWTAQMVKSFAKSVYVSEANKLYVGASELTYVGAIFDGAVSADFS